MNKLPVTCAWCLQSKDKDAPKFCKDHRANPSGRCPHYLTLERRNHLMHKHLGLVHSVALKFADQGPMDYDDLVNEGIFGLGKAVMKYDITKGFEFSTYAIWWIKQYITRGIQNFGRTIRRPVWVQDVVRKINKIKHHLGGKQPTSKQLCHYLGAKFLKIDMNHTKPILSLDYDGDDTGLNHETISGPENLFGFILAKYSVLQMEQTLALVLTEKEHKVIRRRFGFQHRKPATLEVIGAEFGVTRERIRQIEKKALGKLHRAFGRMGITSSEGWAV